MGVVKELFFINFDRQSGRIIENIWFITAKGAGDLCIIFVLYACLHRVEIASKVIHTIEN
jgi:hypothetical protein